MTLSHVKSPFLQLHIGLPVYEENLVFNQDNTLTVLFFFSIIITDFVDLKIGLKL